MQFLAPISNLAPAPTKNFPNVESAVIETFPDGLATIVAADSAKFQTVFTVS